MIEHTNIVNNIQGQQSQPRYLIIDSSWNHDELNTQRLYYSRSRKLWQEINLAFSSLDVDAAMRAITMVLANRNQADQVSD